MRESLAALTSPPSRCHGHSIARPGPSLAAQAASPVTSRACDLLSALVQRSRHPKANVFIREKTNSSCHYFQPKGSARMFSDRRSDVDHGAYSAGRRVLRASLLGRQVLQIPAQSPGPPRPRELLEKRPESRKETPGPTSAPGCLFAVSPQGTGLSGRSRLAHGWLTALPLPGGGDLRGTWEPDPVTV